MKGRLGLGLLLAAALALALRLPRLDQRPMHNDEAVNAIKFGHLWEEGVYRYDPNEHHGPTLFYATVALGKLTGAPGFGDWSESGLRLVTVLFGLGLILLLPLVADGLGRNGTIWAGVFTAVSPAMAFYSRYYIHELLLVFFAFLTLAAAWRYWRSRRVGWALLGWSGVALMHATKETFVLSMAATGLALALNLAWNRWLDAGAPPQRPWRLNWRHMAAGFICGTAIIIVLFSSFFTNASGLLDSLRTFQPWLSRAEGASPHIHPWHFYLHRLLLFHDPKGPVWSEAVIAILGMAGAVAGIRRAGLGQAHAGFVRFVTFYTLSLTAIYSAIPYKTPWCLTGFWHGMILLAGVGAAALLEWAGSRRWKWGVQLCLLAGATQLAWQAWASDVPYAADRRNPYIYSQTSPDILDLVHEVEALAGAGPDGRRMVIKVMAPESDYWPLPWYLRRFTNVGWWSSVPDDPFAPMMIVSAKFHAGLDEKKTHLMPRYFQLRPGVFLELYVELDLWRAYLAKRPSE